jgi:hypothetical protein
MKTFALSFAFWIAASLAQAQTATPRWMTDAEITAFVKGAAIAGEYVDGTLFTESYSLDGEADYFDNRYGRVIGVWSVVNGHFCTIYEHEMKGACFRGVSRGSNCFEFYASTSTPAETANPQGDPAWTARAWRKDRPNTCTVEAV